ncbi:MAG: TonB-dependent receptor plug domain-containing protein [Myxococcota bacterium]
MGPGWLAAYSVAAAAQSARVELVVRERGSGAPVAFASVTVDGAAYTPDADGRVVFDHQPGAVTVEVASPDHAAVSVSLTVPAEGLSDEIWLVPVGVPEEITVYGQDATDAVDREVIGIEELRRVPGSFGDPIRALQALPSVARPRSIEGALVVRGAEADNTGAYVDGVQVPFLFHLLVGKSVIDPSLIDRIEFYPGGLPARYGDVAQAVVDARTDDGPLVGGGLHGDIHVDLMEIGGATRIPLPADFDLRLSGRSSWLSSVVRAGQLVRNEVAGLSNDQYRPAGLRVPYSDFYAKLAHPVGAHGEVFAAAFGADDAIRTIPERQDLNGDGDWDPLPVLPEGTVDLQNQLQNHFTRVVLGLNTAGEVVETHTRAAVGRDHQRNLIEGLGLFTGTPQDLDVHTRSAWLAHRTRITASDAVAIEAGVDGRIRDATLVELGVGPAGDQEGPAIDDAQVWVGPHAALEWTAGPLWVSPGIREASHQLVGAWVHVVEPRGAVRLKLADPVTLRGFAGRFSQAPTADRYAIDGEPPLLIRGTQVSAGAEVGIGGAWSVSVDAYRSWFSDLVVTGERAVLSPAEYEFAQDLAFDPSYVVTTGDATGAELLIRRLPADGWFGWLGASVGRSVRDLDGGIVPSDYDTPFDATLMVARDLPRGWGVSGKVRSGIGQPYTPLGAVYVTSLDIYTPVTGDANAERSPAFFQLDVRIDKTWIARSSRWTVYLDLYNATNHQNPVVSTYNWDYSERDVNVWVPILPTIGAEVSF